MAFKSQKEDIDYYDGDIIFVDDVKKMLCGESISVGMDLVLIFVCTKGEMRTDLKGNTFVLGANQAFVNFPNVVLNKVDVSDDLQCHLFGFTVSAMENVFFIGKNFWERVLQFSDNPIIGLTEMEMRLLHHFYEIAKIEIVLKDHRYQQRILRSLLQSVVYQFFDVIERCDKLLPRFAEPKHSDLIFRRFVEMVGKANGKDRTVASYADKLCVSPKYLSAVVKRVSGKSPLELIHRHAANVIVQQLRYSDKSIKSIANEMAFSSIASLGKFFRSQTGLSPRDYRNKFHQI